MGLAGLSDAEPWEQIEERNWRAFAELFDYVVPNLHGFPDVIAVAFDNGRRSVTFTDLNCAVGVESKPRPKRLLVRAPCRR